MSEKKNIPHKRKNPKYFFRRLTAFFLIIAFIWYFNNYTIKITKTYINSSKLVSSVKIAVMSDYHAEQYGINPKSIIRKINEINPDVVFYLGDMYSSGTSQENIDKAESLMIDTVKAGYEVFFVAGDHDTSVEYLNILMQNDVNVMNYQSQELEIRGNKIKIYGINNAYFPDTFNLSNEFQLDDSYYNILMAHIPMYNYYNDFGADLTVCGDTHGGMIQFPFGLGAVYDSVTKKWLPELKYGKNNVYDKGLFRLSGSDKYMFITSGLGNYPIPARLNNRPEIAVIQLNPY